MTDYIKTASGKTVQGRQARDKVAARDSTRFVAGAQTKNQSTSSSLGCVVAYIFLLSAFLNPDVFLGIL